MASSKRTLWTAFSLLGFLLCLPLAGGERYRVAAQRPIPPTKTAVPAGTPSTNPTSIATPSLLSPSCPPSPASVPANVAHVFSESELPKAMSSQSNLIIVAHGTNLETPLNFVLAQRYEEFVPVFVSKKRNVSNLSKDQLIKILRGEIRDWEQLGDTPSPIFLYLHSGVYQKMSFEKFLETLGLSPADLKAPNIRYSSDYRDLKVSAGKDPNALVIGLRELEPEDLKTIAIDGFSISDPNQLQQYPLRISVNLYKRDTPQAGKPLEKEIKRIDKNNPLDEVMEAAGRQEEIRLKRARQK
jgi:hypothetical protein